MRDIATYEANACDALNFHPKFNRVKELILETKKKILNLGVESEMF